MTTAAQTRVLILGMGISGLAMARWCAQLGHLVRVADTRQAPQGQAALLQSVPDAECVLGAFSGELLCNALGHVDVAAVYCSPGLSPEEVAAVRNTAAQSGVFFGGELDLFSHALRQLAQDYGYRPHVLAITGTNGKTTVTSLTAALLKRADWRVAVAGNIGPSLLDTLTQHQRPSIEAWAHEQSQTQQAAAQNQADAMASAAEPLIEVSSDDVTQEAGGQQSIESAVDDSESAAIVDEANKETSIELTVPDAPVTNAFVRAMPQVWVLELSSFQLDYSSSFEPTASTILNITQDHLDWHGSMQAYIEAKAKIYGKQATIIMNRDDADTMALLPALHAAAGATETKRSTRQRSQAVAQRKVIRFGLQTPEQAGDWGVQEAANMWWLARAYSDEVVGNSKSRKAVALEVYLQKLMPADAMRIRGRHNVSNALAALALATTTGAPLAAMLHGLREYRGEPHRAQSVGVIAGVEYVDDSKATNVGATVAALQGLGGARKLVVILGGDGKGQDFSPLRDAVATTARAVVLLGRDADLIADALTELDIEMSTVDDLPAAVEKASKFAREGDVVLLSPACSSLDMFRNYEHRAQVFVDSVRNVALDAGQELEVWA